MYRTLSTGDAFMVIPVPRGSTPAEMKEEVFERLSPQPTPIPQHPSFSTPTIPYKVWPAVLAVGVIYGAYLIWRTVPVVP